eukprot:m.38254 g.38254  ORF g.38254 m.38254 type:complete len:79 (+) comp6787_c0_seq5:81-317(+)
MHLKKVVCSFPKFSSFSSLSLLFCCSMMANPTEDRFRDAIAKGQQCTWPKMNIILNHCRIEFALDEILRNMHEAEDWV